MDSCLHGHELTEDNIYSDRRGKKTCHTCKLEQGRRYTAANREKANQRSKEWYNQNTDKAKSRIKKYKEDNKDKYLEYHKEYYKANKETHAQAGKLYAEQNKDKVQAYQQQYRVANKEKKAAYGKAWRTANAGKVRVTRAANKSKRRCAGKFPTENWAALLEAFGTWCPYCETDGHKLTVDHITPICKGGDNSIENLMPCCPSCNASKNGKYIGQWKPQLSFLSLQGDI